MSAPTSKAGSIKKMNNEVGMKTITANSTTWKRRISLVLIFTMLFSVFTHQGWYKPKSAEAAITTLQAWSNIYNATTAPATVAYPITGTGLGARMLVVAVSGSMTAASATRTMTLTYGGQAMTKATTDETTSARTHTWLFYLQEAGITAATNSNLVFTITNPGTTRFYQVDAAVYDSVDQSGAPITNSQSYLNDGTAATAIGPFATGLTIGAGDTAVEIVSAVRYASTTPRTVSTWAANWSGTFGPTTLASTDSINVYVATDTTAVTTTSQHTASGTTNCSMSAMSIKMLPMNLAVTDPTNPASANAGQGTVNNPLDGFTMAASAGSVTVNTLTLTGSANFTAANIVGISVYRDNGTLGALDGADVLVPSSYSAIAGGVTTITFAAPETILSAAARNYLITVDIAGGATAGQTFTGRITAATGAIGTATYNDTTSATLTIQSAPGLTITDPTNPANDSAGLGSRNNALDGFTLQTANALGGTGAIDTLTITGSANFTSANVSDIHVYQDNGTAGSFDAGDVLAPSTATVISGNTTTLTFSPPLYVTNATKNYLLVVDIAPGATLTQSFTARVTAAAGHGLATPTYSDATSATLTIKQYSSKVSSCSDCHGYPPLDGTSRNNPAGAVVGSHQKHQDAPCSTCHVAPATTGPADFGHRTGNILMKNPFSGVTGSYSRGTSFPQTNNPTTGTCSNVGCHGGNNPTPQWGVGTTGCINCHSAQVTALKASALSGGAVTNRDAITTEFGLAWGHKKTGRTAVSDADCIVCHLEGQYQGGVVGNPVVKTAYHADGYIDLRNPDGAGETEITYVSSPTTSFKFIQFSTSYSPGSRTATGHLSDNIDNVLTQKFCLACHDSNGATNPTARSNNGGTGTATMPFGGINLGANYTVANGAAAAGGVVDVKTQLATSNRSWHPVSGPKNRDFPTAARMNDPYKPTGTRGTAGTLSQGVVMNCFDCHNVSGASPLTTRTVAAHGNAQTIRGVATVSGTPSAANDVTFCKVCHAGYVTGTTQHGAGSGLSGNTDSGMTAYLNYGCNICHSSGYTTAVPRPIIAQDTHGSNALGTVGTLITTTSRWSTDPTPIAFIRNRQVLPQHQPKRIGATTYTNPTCMGGNVSPCSQGSQNYSVGGTY